MKKANPYFLYLSGIINENQYYEMTENNVQNEMSYDNPPDWMDDDREFKFKQMLGEDKTDPYSVEVEIENDDWTVIGDILVRNYVPNGSENPISRPEYVKDNTVGDGTFFYNPGNKLQNLPSAIKNHALDWIQHEVNIAISKYDSTDDEPEYEPDNPDPHGDAHWDRYWNKGPGRDR
jgi:hypothetical protein